ncbi:MAG: signal peptidase II [Planctomycetota bacterium]
MNIPHATIRPAWRSRRAWTMLLLLATIGLAADLVSKHIAFERVAGTPVHVLKSEVEAAVRTGGPAVAALIPPHEETRVIPGVLSFKLVLNTGAVFGAGQGKRWLFVVFTGVAFVFALWLFALRTDARDRVAHVAIALVLAGGLGNLYDRLRYACVRDFIHPLPGWRLPFGLRWPGGSDELWPYVSNVADKLLLIGIGVLLVVLWREDTAREPATPSA